MQATADGKAEANSVPCGVTELTLVALRRLGGLLTSASDQSQQQVSLQQEHSPLSQQGARSHSQLQG